MSKLYRIKKFAREHLLLSGLALFLVGLLSSVFLRGADVPTTVESVIEEGKSVSMLSLASYEGGGGYVDVSGQIESTDDVTLTSQVSSRIQRVNIKLGDNVYKGQVLVSFNADELRAQVAQTEATIEAEEIRLKELQSGARPEELQSKQTRVTNAAISLDDAERTLGITREKAEQDFIHAHDNALFAAQRSVELAKSAILVATSLQEKYFYASTVDQSDIVIRTKKADVMSLLFDKSDAGRWNWNSVSLADGGLYSEIKDLSSLDNLQDVMNAIDNTRTVLIAVRELLDSIPEKEAFTSTEKTNLSTQQGTISSEISSLQGKIQAIETQRKANESSIAAAEAQVRTAESNLRNAENDLSLSEAGTSKEQIQSQAARIRSLQASLQGLYAQLAKATITAPTSGSVAELSATLGEQANIGQPMVTIVNTDVLQVKVYLSIEERSRVSSGAPVIIKDKYKGVVSVVAPSIDPQNGKVETLIFVEEDKTLPPLTVGEVVTVRIEDTSTNDSSTFRIPISAVRIQSTGASVFSVDNDMANAIPVTVGRIIGDHVEVLSGLTGDEEIISSIHGLAPGDKVIITE